MSRRPLLAVPVALVALLVGGCGDDAADNAAEKKVEEAAASQGKDIDVDVDGDEVKVKGDGIEAEVGTGNLPKDFPEDDVPLVDGDVYSGVKAAEGFQVQIESDDFEGAVDKLKDAGFTEVSTIGEGAIALEGNGYNVMVTSLDVGDQSLITYAVSGG